MYDYNCFIARWLDGDTVSLVVDLGFHVSLKINARVHGINASELHAADGVEKIKGMAALEHARRLAPEGTVVKVASSKTADHEKFGRWLAVITLANGKDFAAEMTGAGHAVAYFGGKR